jgi:hypothetical protein
MIRGLRGIVRREAFDDFAELENSGAYFFSMTPVLTEAVKVS